MPQPTNKQVYAWRKDKAQLWVSKSDIPKLEEIQKKYKLKNLQSVITLLIGAFDNNSKVK
jgi:hypothetical protein